MPERELYELRRALRLLFQGAALFDSMTVFENIALGLGRTPRYPWRDITRIVADKLAMVGCRASKAKSPPNYPGYMRKAWSGPRPGEQSRVHAVRRTDHRTRSGDLESNRCAIADITAKLSATSIVVTHDMFSVYTIEHTVAMMHEGRIYVPGHAAAFRSSEDPVIRGFIERFGNRDSARSTACRTAPHAVYSA